MEKKYAIVGFGCAGYHAAVSARDCDKKARIDVYDMADRPPFNPMLSTYLADGRISEDEAFPFGDAETIAERLNLNMYLGVRVSRVDTGSRTIELEDGTKKSYDAILIATGARAFVPDSLKSESGNVFLMRTLDDAKRLREYLDRNAVKKAVVTGASMTGIKVAELLYKKGIEVTLMDAAPYIFPLAAYPEIAQRIEERLEKAGIRLRMNAGAKRITGQGVELADGSVAEGSVVCLCIGTRANVELAADTRVVEQQKIDIRKGIVIDSRGQSSCGGIYAAGDCCEGTNLQTGETSIIGLWDNAAAQGKCAGRNLAGADDEYRGNIPHNITHFFDMDFIGLGDPQIAGEKYTFENEDFVVSVVKDETGLKSVNILGNYRISGVLKNYFIKRLLHADAKLNEVQRGLLRDSGLSGEFIRLIGD